MRVLSFFIFSFCVLLAKAQDDCTNHWETIILPDNIWKYAVDSAFDNQDWKSLSYNDADWNEGEGGIGYGDDDDATIVPNCKILYQRKQFSLEDTSLISQALLSIDYDDAFVAYLNGAEIARSGLLDKFPDANSAVELREATMYSGGYPKNFDIPKDTLVKYLNQGQNLLAVQVHNQSANSSDLSSIIYLSLGVSSPDQLYGPISGDIVLPVSHNTAFDIPLVSIETHGLEIGRGDKITADMKIIDNGNAQFNYLSDSGNVYTGKIAIKVRGSSSAGFPQKSYRLETRDSAGENLNIPLLGMPEENDWLLISNYYDRSFVRNFLSHEIFRGMGHYSPRIRYCEVVLNGEYKGVYLLAEKIKVDKDRLDLAKLNPDENTGDDVTGGYIIKNDNYDPLGSDSWFVDFPKMDELEWGAVRARFVYEYPDWDVITSQQKNYIKEYIETSKDALYGDEFTDPTNGYRAYFDARSFIDYFLISEISRNGDAYKKSRFFHKNKESNGGLLHAGPPWDFDWAWKNLFFQSSNGSGWAHSYEAYGYGDVQPVRLMNRMLLDPYFANEAYNRYFDLRETVLDHDNLSHKIDSIAAYLSNAQVRHFEQWDVLNGNSGDPDSHVPESFEDEIDHLKDWISIRLTWLDNNMDKFQHEIDTTAIVDTTSQITLSEPLPIKFSIYPNPAKNNFTVQLPDEYRSNEMVYLKITTLIGKVIFEETFNARSEIRVQTDLPTGMYVVEIATALKKLASEKVLIKN
ncbi:MAG: CotH kinase family protein [Cyclobacteriaceae bacterium]